MLSLLDFFLNDLKICRQGKYFTYLFVKNILKKRIVKCTILLPLNQVFKGIYKKLNIICG